MDRITDKMLENLALRINRATGSPETAYTRQADGRLRANVGNYHVGHAYGGVCLHRMLNEYGGVMCPLDQRYAPKRELWGRMQAFLAGINSAK